MNSNGFIPTYDFSKISEVDMIILCLPTPIKKINLLRCFIF